MSYIRASSKRRFSKPSSSESPMYVFKSGPHGEEREYFIDWMMGDPTNEEDLCELMFKILEQSNIEVDLEMVNKVRDRLGIEPLEELSDKVFADWVGEKGYGVEKPRGEDDDK